MPDSEWEEKAKASVLNVMTKSCSDYWPENTFCLRVRFERCRSWQRKQELSLSTLLCYLCMQARVELCCLLT